MRLETRKGQVISPGQQRANICKMIQMNENINFIREMIEANASELEGPVLPDGSTLLHVAAQMGSVDVVVILAIKKVRLNA